MAGAVVHVGLSSWWLMVLAAHRQVTRYMDKDMHMHTRVVGQQADGQEDVAGSVHTYAADRLCCELLCRLHQAGLP